MLLSFTLLSACAPTGARPTSARPPGALPQARPPAELWDHWGDGRAELSGYRLIQPRYGQARRGEAVLVFVTEDFTAGDRVKSDGGHGDEFPVIKLNEIRDFQTGVYDYNAMTSVFVRLDGADPVGVPTKVSFGMQEWCGQVYDQLITHPGRYERTSHSYFDGEADRGSVVALPTDALFLDGMPLLARGFVGPLVEPGAQLSVSLHPRLIDLRFAHAEASWLEAQLSRAPRPTSIEVPAGRFEVERFTVAVGQQRWSYDIERAQPHRLIRWQGPDGELGELTGSIREPYWRLHDNGHEQVRARLGLGDPSWLWGDSVGPGEGVP